MDASKLFQVLVIGGAMLGLGCVESAPAGDAGDVGTDAASAADAALAAADAAADVDTGAAPSGDAGELVECGLCPNEACCETQPDGTSTTRAGMVCCWGTSC